MQLDSAAVLLREALDTSGHPMRSDQVEAWLLLGVISFYKGDDSGTAGDFRHAIALDPLLKSDGLARCSWSRVTCRSSPSSKRCSAASRGPRLFRPALAVDGFPSWSRRGWGFGPGRS